MSRDPTWRELGLLAQLAFTCGIVASLWDGTAAWAMGTVAVFRGVQVLVGAIILLGAKRP